MKALERRLRMLEQRIERPKPWRRVIVDVGESEEEALAREGIGPDDNVILIQIVEPGGGTFQSAPNAR